METRAYDHAADFKRIGDWLSRSYRREGEHVNWLQPRWEYMHFHPLIRNVHLPAIGVWEADREIVGVAHPEHSMGTIYFQFHPARPSPKAAMLTYAERNLCAQREGRKGLRVFVNERDTELTALVEGAGYAPTQGGEVMSRLAVADAPAPPEPPAGFRLLSLAEENDRAKITRLFWRGFNHGPEPPDDAPADRELMQSAPNYRRDLNLVIANAAGDYVAYGGIWFEERNRVAYVEPVATDPDYRRLGLACIVVLEGIRRCGELGATEVYVGAEMPFYLSLGFEPVYRCSLWRREWPD